MKEKFKKIFSQIKRLLIHFKRSFAISWKASPLLFCIRIAYEMVLVGIPIISLYLSRTVINILSSPPYEGKVLDFYKYVAFIILMQLISMILKRLMGHLSGLFNDLIGKQIDLEIIDQINRLDISYFDNPTFHDEMQNAMRDSRTLQNLVWISLTFIRSIVQLFSYLAIMISLNPLMPLMILACSLPGLFIDKYIAKRQYDWQLGRARSDRKLGYLKGLLQSKGTAKDLRVFDIQDYIKSRFLAMWKEWFSEKVKLEKFKFSVTSLASLLPLVSTTVVMVVVGTGIINGNMTVGDYSLYGGAASQLLGAIVAFTGVINQSYESEMRLSRYADFLKMEPLVKNEGKNTIEEVNSIEFRNVSFTYPHTDIQILKNVSFTIHQNQSLALVGLNGAGKSTIVKLILRLYDPDSGEILVNGVNLKNYDIHSYYKCIGAVFQDFCRYDLKIRETIALTDIDAMDDDERVLRAYKSAEINVDIDSLKDGIDTYLGKTFDPDGLELSGGNWQKVAIAQAFFKNASLMLFDEPNAALDPDAERNLFEKMVELGHSKCVVYVTHRLSAATTASQILVINDGECVEMGTHSELIEKKGLYYDLFNKQAEFYRV